MAKELDDGLELIDFEIQSCYDVHFRINAPWKGMDPLILSAIG